MTRPEQTTQSRSKAKTRNDDGANNPSSLHRSVASSPAGDLALTDDDLHLFNEGTHYHLYRKLGAHLAEHDGTAGAWFSVWAPNANRVSVIGDFNDWSPGRNSLDWIGASGIWRGFLPGVEHGQRYKYHIESRHNEYCVDKTDPIGFFSEVPPNQASIVWDLDYEWSDHDWMRQRAERNSHRSPMSIYEVHLGSWRRDPNQPDRFLSYREIAPQLAEYVKKMGFTHVELMPVMEHPLYRSWGYQVTGYFAATSRYGTPQDLMHLIDLLHQHDIGVILDWAPAHFPSDEHGLTYFDGTHLYEHADEDQRIHPDWGSYIFNYSRHEVKAFLISSAVFWMDKYHVDGLRVDAVASMLYLDYSREDGQWRPNKYGGNENLEALEFIRDCNKHVYGEFPGVQMIAEESTAWPMVSKPTYVGGLGYGFKWDMGWMHDTLKYFSQDSIYRPYHHNELTFRSVYAFSENFILPLSHDEVVHGKGSLLGKMPGDEWQRFANLRLLLSYMWTQPGKKLMFMGGEFGQGWEWSHEQSLDWSLLQYEYHSGLQRMVETLNALYQRERALHELDCESAGFEWIDGGDVTHSVLSYMRHSSEQRESIVVVANFTPVVRQNYRVGVPRSGFWQENFNSDASEYGGSGQGNLGGVETTPAKWHGREHSVRLTLPPLGLVMLKSG